MVPTIIFSSAMAENPEPVIPGDIVALILRHLHEDTSSLKACTLVCSAWTSTSRYHLFHRFFPTVDDWSKRKTHFPSCLYFLQWKLFMEKVPANVQLAAKGKLLERFRTLWWIPAADGERMWNTKRGSGQYSLLPPDSIVPSPQIVVNRAHHKVVSSFRLGVPENL